MNHIMKSFIIIAIGLAPSALIQANSKQSHLPFTPENLDNIARLCTQHTQSPECAQFIDKYTQHKTAVQQKFTQLCAGIDPNNIQQSSQQIPSKLETEFIDLVFAKNSVEETINIELLQQKKDQQNSNITSLLAGAGLVALGGVLSFDSFHKKGYLSSTSNKFFIQATVAAFGLGSFLPAVCNPSTFTTSIHNASDNWHLAATSSTAINYILLLNHKKISETGVDLTSLLLSNVIVLGQLFGSKGVGADAQPLSLTLSSFLFTTATALGYAFYERQKLTAFGYAFTAYDNQKLNALKTAETRTTFTTDLQKNLTAYFANFLLITGSSLFTAGMNAWFNAKKSN